MQDFADCSEVLITVVDNYQGEENDIVLLSLVRSNEANSIGFLNVLGRVCVSLSRARNGLFVVGNLDELSKNSNVWQRIGRVLQGRKVVADSLELSCDFHVNPFRVASVEDWEGLRNRGCQRLCGDLLGCGHLCDRPCHVVDKTGHVAEFKCVKTCQRTCAENHPCQR